MRHSRKEIEWLAAKLAYALGAPAFGNCWTKNAAGKNVAIIGAMQIEYMNPGDGGTYRLREIVTEGGGIRDNVAGPYRMTLGEFAIALYAGLETARRILGEDEYARRVQKAFRV